MVNALETSIRTLIGFFLLLLLTRLLGKKQLGQITYFTYITGIAMGNIAGDMVVHKDVKLIDALVGLSLWALLTFIFEYSSLKSTKLRVMLDGEPTIVIKKGVIIEKALSSTKLNLDDLTMLLRSKNVFSIREVDYAILEPNGDLSVLKKPEYELTIKRDIGIPTLDRPYLPSEIIVDGKVVLRNLKELNLTQQWLDNQLKLAGVTSYKDVLFAEIQSDGSLYLNKKEL